MHSKSGPNKTDQKSRATDSKQTGWLGRNESTQLGEAQRAVNGEPIS